MEKNICKESIFDIYDVHELKRLLDIGKTDKDIRKTFRGKCVLLECSLSNYLDFVTALNESSNVEVVCATKEVEKDVEDSDERSVTSDYLEQSVHQGQVESINPVYSEVGQNDKIIDRFFNWCIKKGYKERTAKGFLSGINAAERFAKENNILKKNVFEIVHCEEIDTLVTKMKNHSAFKPNSFAHYVYSLSVYANYLAETGDIEKKPEKSADIKSKQYATYLDEVNILRDTLLKYPDIGLYLKQICDAVLMDTQKVEKILDNAPWCKKLGKRYYYNEQIDISWEDMSYLDDVIEDDDILYEISSETADEEKLKMMNEDLEILLKRLKEEKGIK